jgi:hypothetical protein
MDGVDRQWLPPSCTPDVLMLNLGHGIKTAAQSVKIFSEVARHESYRL